MPGILALLASPFTRDSYIPEVLTSPHKHHFYSKSSGSEAQIVYSSIRAFVQAKCPSLSEPYIPPWWLFSGHLQTLYSVLGDFRSVDRIRYERTYLRTPDGGTLGLDFSPPEDEGSLLRDVPIVVVLHGLTGGSYESYVRSILSKACMPISMGGLGYRAVVINFRGCADVPLTSERLYSAGTTEDLATALLFLTQEYPGARLLGLGFSLGANVMTRYLVEEGVRSRLYSACVLGCPWDLTQVTHSLEKGFFSRNIYSKGMGRNVVSVIRKNLINLHKLNTRLITPYLPELLESKDLLLRDVDEMAIRLIGGPSPPFPFASAWEYYTWASNHEKIDRVRTPLLIINSKDDPIVLNLPSIERDSGYSILALTRGGGHLGWFSNSGPEGLQRWVRKPVLEWLKATAEDLVVKDKSPGREIEVSAGFVREIGKNEVGYQVISTRTIIDWSQNRQPDHLAGVSSVWLEKIFPIMFTDSLDEEIQVLESIYPNELKRINERRVQMSIAHDLDALETVEDDVGLQLEVAYPEAYPEMTPEFSIFPITGTLDNQETVQLLQSIRLLAKRNIGEPSTFTVVSHLKEELDAMIRSRSKKRRENAEKAEQLALQAEAQRTKGTPVTATSFEKWKTQFLRELKMQKEKDQNEKLKGLSNKEREEMKRVITRQTGRQLFEKNRHLDDTDDAFEDGVVSVDFSQYASTAPTTQVEEDSKIIFEDSD